jgi:hypothetical protein
MASFFGILLLSSTIAALNSFFLGTIMEEDISQKRRRGKSNKRDKKLVAVQFSLKRVKQPEKRNKNSLKRATKRLNGAQEPGPIAKVNKARAVESEKQQKSTKKKRGVIYGTLTGPGGEAAGQALIYFYKIPGADTKTTKIRRVYCGSVTTDHLGRFSHPLAYGHYQLRAHKSGFRKSNFQPVNVTADSQDISLQLKAPYKLKIHVKDQMGQAITNATVIIVDARIQTQFHSFTSQYGEKPISKVRCSIQRCWKILTLSQFMPLATRPR